MVLRFPSTLRCEDGRLMRFSPQWDDPYLEYDIGQCPDCCGHGRSCRECGMSHASQVTLLCEECAPHYDETEV